MRKANPYPEKKHYILLENNTNLDKKRCNACNKIYPLNSDYFGTDLSMESKFSQTCKECAKIRFKKNYNKHSTEIAQRHRDDPRYIFRHIINGAQKRNIIFNLEYDYYLNKLFKKCCYYCGGETAGWLDRIENNKDVGYTNSNAASCCDMCNKMKLDYSKDNFLNHIEKISKFQKFI